MQLKINPEIREYKESIYFGLSLRQFIWSIIAIFVGVIAYFSLNNKVNIELTSWLSMLSSLPFVLIGFIKYNGMTCEKLFMVILRNHVLTPMNLKFKTKNLYKELSNIKERKHKNVWKLN